MASIKFAVLITALTVVYQGVSFANDAKDAKEASPKEQDPRAERQLPKRKGEISFDDLVFNIEKDAPFQRDLLTEKIEKLHGQTLLIRGYILPASVFQQSGISQFVLVRDNKECCFGPGAALYDCVMVQMKSPATAEFSTRPVAVKGRFEIKEFKYPDDSGHYAIFQIEATEAK
jgi:hypothetical protein